MQPSAHTAHHCKYKFKAIITHCKTNAPLLSRVRTYIYCKLKNIAHAFAYPTQCLAPICVSTGDDDTKCGIIMQRGMRLRTPCDGQLPVHNKLRTQCESPYHPKMFQSHAMREVQLLQNQPSHMEKQLTEWQI